MLSSDLEQFLDAEFGHVENGQVLSEAKALLSAMGINTCERLKPVDSVQAFTGLLNLAKQLEPSEFTAVKITIHTVGYIVRAAQSIASQR